MYTAHFGLTELPFSITPDPRYLYMSEAHREALAHLLYGIGEGGGGGFVQLTGEVGTGKTTLCRQLAEAAGLNFAHARLDRSAHPFCGGTQTDVRITTRYDEMDFCSALMGVLHETGHAMYEQNLPKTFQRQPVGQIGERHGFLGRAFHARHQIRDDLGIDGNLPIAEQFHEHL